MNILSGKEIQKTIKKCNPSKIAVAYIGADWESFVDPKNLEAIILSPTLGSNPKAIKDLVKKINGGWESVYFLDELHAKIYLGDEVAVVGSSNLTKNGLDGGDNSLLELCVEISDKSSIREIGDAFSNFQALAKKRYPESQDKKNRLVELENLWNAALVNKVVVNGNKTAPSLKDFDVLANDEFYVCWYQSPRSETDYTENAKAFTSIASDEMEVAHGEKINKNKWMLTWKINNDGTPHKTADLDWMYIHDIIENAVVSEYGYTTIAIEREDMEKPEVPFELTKEVSRAFKKIVTQEDMVDYFVQDINEYEGFLIEKSIPGLKELVSRMKGVL